MEKNHSMFRVVTHCLGAFRRPLFSSIGTQLGAKHPPPPHIYTPGTEVLKELPFACGDGGGVGGGAASVSLENTKKFRRACTRVFFFFFFSFVVVRERRI